MSHRSPIDRARAYHDEPEAYWQGRPGDVVGGRVVAIDVRSTQYEPRVPVIILEQTSDGSRLAIWALHQVLRDELVRLQPRIGDEIAIRRLDDSEHGYARYRVFGSRDDGEFDWSSVGAPASQAPSETPAAARAHPPDLDSFTDRALEVEDDLPF